MVLPCSLWWLLINSSPPGAAYMRQWTGSALVQVMACRLFGAKPLPELMLAYCQLNSCDQTSVKFESEFCHFHSWKCIWIWRPFCPGRDELMWVCGIHLRAFSHAPKLLFWTMNLKIAFLKSPPRIPEANKYIANMLKWRKRGWRDIRFMSKYRQFQARFRKLYYVVMILHLSIKQFFISFVSYSVHYNYVIMGPMAFQITGVSIVYSTVCSGADQEKHQSSASLAFVRGIHRWPVNSLHKWSVTPKIFPFYDVIMKSDDTLIPGHHVDVIP